MSSFVFAFDLFVSLLLNKNTLVLRYHENLLPTKLKTFCNPKRCVFVS